MLVLDDLQTEINRRFFWETEEMGNIIVQFNYQSWGGNNYEFIQLGKKKPERTQYAFRYLSVETLIKA